MSAVGFLLLCVLSTVACAIVIVSGRVLLGLWKKFQINKEKVTEMKSIKFSPMVVPQEKVMGWETVRFVGKAEIRLDTPIEVILADGTFAIGTPLPGSTVVGNIVKIVVMRYAEWFNKFVGWVRFTWNGRFGQPMIEQVPGRMVFYGAKHPELGWLLGGADEPREHCNGTMRTAAGGYDAKSKDELDAINKMELGPDRDAAMVKYGKTQAAREVLQEMGLDVTHLDEVGKGLSNRSIYMADLTDMEHWNGEWYYIVVVPFEMLVPDGDKFVIHLPNEKEGDVRPAPEWSAIKKLTFLPALDNADTLDTVAAAGYFKAYKWLLKNHGE